MWLSLALALLWECLRGCEQAPFFLWTTGTIEESSSKAWFCLHWSQQESLSWGSKINPCFEKCRVSHSTAYPEKPTNQEFIWFSAYTVFIYCITETALGQSTRQLESPLSMSCTMVREQGVVLWQLRKLFPHLPVPAFLVGLSVPTELFLHIFLTCFCLNGLCQWWPIV